MRDRTVTASSGPAKHTPVRFYLELNISTEFAHGVFLSSLVLILFLTLMRSGDNPGAGVLSRYVLRSWSTCSNTRVTLVSWFDLWVAHTSISLACTIKATVSRGVRGGLWTTQAEPTENPLAIVLPHHIRMVKLFQSFQQSHLSDRRDRQTILVCWDTHTLQSDKLSALCVSGLINSPVSTTSDLCHWLILDTGGMGHVQVQVD